jgi:chromate transporter
MKAASTLALGKLFAAMSLAAIGGANAIVPEIHREVVVRHGWLSERAFADLFAVSQATPGPNLLIVSLVGWKLTGAAGLAVATLAFLAPSILLVLAVGRLMHRRAIGGAVALLQEALAPIAVSLVAASGLIMAQAADTSLLLLLITVGSATFVVGSRRNPLWALAIGVGLVVVAQSVSGRR